MNVLLEIRSYSLLFYLGCCSTKQGGLWGRQAEGLTGGRRAAGGRAGGTPCGRSEFLLALVASILGHLGVGPGALLPH